MDIFSSFGGLKIILCPSRVGGCLTARLDARILATHLRLPVALPQVLTSPSELLRSHPAGGWQHLLPQGGHWGAEEGTEAPGTQPGPRTTTFCAPLPKLALTVTAFATSGSGPLVRGDLLRWGGGVHGAQAPGASALVTACLLPELPCLEFSLILVPFS